MNTGLNRREFLHLGTVGAAALTAGKALGASAGSAEPSKSQPARAGLGTVTEPAREVPVVEGGDVIVCGAGPAGVAAAIASARAGAKTMLLELHGCLGGIWTTGALSWILDHQNKRGIMAELLKRLTERDGRTFTKKGTPTNAYDIEVMKLLLEEMCAEAGVRVQLHTRVCAAAKNADGRLTHVIAESKSGREAFAAKTFIDCTGEGDLGAAAGCGFDFGHPQTGLTQPMSLMALITGVVPEEISEFYRDVDAGPWAQPKDKLRAEMERGGHSPSYAKPTIFRVRDELFAMMANHEYGVKGTDARDVTRATLHARKEINNLINGLRSLGGPWKNLRLVATAAQIGVREGRRLHGLYTVSTDDLRDGRTHPDGVCKVTFGIDVHATDPKKEKGIEKAGFRAKPYDIPLRALIARDVKGLMMAGRCISGDFIAHSSYRVTGDSVALGEAAGVTAALAARSGKLPQDVPWAEIQKKLNG
ncbi:MAG: FAD-dependent oxidoreductase [Verrucomicrobia bacterium]|nr:FAD-dependent oxidoreductase [Verrucomicrobiota bacterium]